MKYLMMFLVLLLAVSAMAAPAPWYRWRSLVDGALVCSQTSPGEGWAVASGPYKDSRCRVPGRIQ